MMARRVAGILPPLMFDEALEATSVHSVAGLLPAGTRPASAAAVPRAAPHDLGCRARRRRADSKAGRDQPRARRRAVPRRDGRIQPARARSVAAAARGRHRAHRASRADRFLPRAVHADRRDESLPLRFRRRSRSGVPVHAGSRVALRNRDSPDRCAIASTLRSPSRRCPPTSCNRDRPGGIVRRRSARGSWPHASVNSPRSGVLNARLQGRALRARATLSADARPMVMQAMARLSLSARAYDRILRVARTIADLEGIEQTSAQHVAEALQFRGP